MPLANVVCIHSLQWVSCHQRLISLPPPGASVAPVWWCRGPDIPTLFHGLPQGPATAVQLACCPTSQEGGGGGPVLLPPGQLAISSLYCPLLLAERRFCEIFAYKLYRRVTCVSKWMQYHLLRFCKLEPCKRFLEYVATTSQVVTAIMTERGCFLFVFGLCAEKLPSRFMTLV